MWCQADSREKTKSDHELNKNFNEVCFKIIQRKDIWCFV